MRKEKKSLRIRAKKGRKKSRLLLIIGMSITLTMVLIGLVSIFWIPLDVNESDPSIRMLPVGSPVICSEQTF